MVQALGSMNVLNEFHLMFVFPVWKFRPEGGATVKVRGSLAAVAVILWTEVFRQTKVMHIYPVSLK